MQHVTPGPGRGAFSAFMQQRRPTADLQADRNFDYLIKLVAVGMTDANSGNGASAFMLLSHYLIDNQMQAMLAALEK